MSSLPSTAVLDYTDKNTFRQSSRRTAGYNESIDSAKEIWASLDNEEKTALWSLLDSKTRSTFKKG